MFSKYPNMVIPFRTISIWWFSYRKLRNFVFQFVLGLSFSFFFFVNNAHFLIWCESKDVARRLGGEGDLNGSLLWCQCWVMGCLNRSHKGFMDLEEADLKCPFVWDFFFLFLYIFLPNLFLHSLAWISMLSAVYFLAKCEIL